MRYFQLPPMCAYPNARLWFATTFAALGLLCSAVAEDGGASGFRLEREMIQLDRGDLQLPANWKDSGKGPLPGSNWAEYDFEVPKDGWYVLSFEDLPNLAREIFVDGERVSLSFGESPRSAAELLGMPLAKMTQNGWSKGANLPLHAGKHVLRFQRVGRMGFPAGMPRAWELRAAGDAARDRVQARVVGFRELRKGEPLKLSVTAGHGPASEFEIYRIDEQKQTSEKVATLAFPKSDTFLTKPLEIPSTAEGVFQVHAKTGDALLSPQEFIESSYFVVDTTTRPSATGADARKKLLYEVDCVGNTINGSPVAKGVNYWEANGPTRINESTAGKYRESNNGLGPDVEPHPKQLAENFSGFGYLFDVPQPGRPYLIEIDHPDDDWRSVCVAIVDVFDKANKKGVLQPTEAFETGGYLPLSGKMLTERMMYWPNGKQIHVSLTSSRIGKRAAAAKIRIYEIEGDLPSQVASRSGRFVGVYMEEMKRWHTHFNTSKELPPAVRDFVGLQRTMEWAAYTGFNAFWPSAMAYQEATYDSRVLDGHLLQSYNVPRLSALLCEKYGLGYVAEIFLSKQKYFVEKTMLEGADKPEDLYTATWWGFRACDNPSVGGILPSWNILHPHVQEKVIQVYGDLADSLGDTRSFLGMSGRLDSWQWDGLLALSSLNWGYEDWTIGQFEKDTSITVPGELSDPKRYEKRYRFLVAPEMKARWVAWRQERMTQFLRKLSARIREKNKDAVFFLIGNARTDESHSPSTPADFSERLAGMGIDVAALANEPGISIMPFASYGRGKTRTYVTDQEEYDNFLNPDFTRAGAGALKGFAQFGFYQEWGDEFPLDKLGIPLERWWYTSSSDAAGRNALERLSAVLAEQDTMAIRDGSYPLLWGRRDYFSQWMAEFSQLPRLPFEPVAVARDPVAVWQRADASGYLFYVVNREQYPVTITLGLEGAQEVTRLGTQEKIILAKGALTLDLQPYELRAFRAEKGALIRTAETKVPEERVKFVEKRLAFAQDLVAKMTSGPFKDSFTDEQKAVFRKKLDQATEAFQNKAYWRARTLLSSAPMVRIYEKFGEYPEGQVLAQFPNSLTDSPTDRFDPVEEFTDAAALFAAVVPGAGATLVDSATFNPEWKFNQVVQSAGRGVEFDLNVPSPGTYKLSLGYISKTPGAISASLNGQDLAIPMMIHTPGEPERVVFPSMKLPAGKVRLTITRNDPFGIYAAKLTPVLMPLPTTVWSTVGPFRSFWIPQLRASEMDAALKKGADTVYPPQENPSITATYKNENGEDLKWTQTREIIGSHEDAGVNFAQRAGILSTNFGFAQTFITSPEEQDAVFYLGSDWWANAYLNGELLKPDGKREEQESTGFWFNRWKPRPVKVHLKKGENRLLVKNQGGNMNCWFTAYITDPGNLKVSPLPEAN